MSVTEEAAKLYIKYNGNLDLIRGELHCQPKGLQDALRRAREQGLLPAEKSKHEKEADKLTTKVKNLEAELAAIVRDNNTAASVREQIFGLAGMTADPPKWIYEPRTKRGNPEVPILFASDWHYGEVVNPDQVGGVNSFNREIGKERIKELAETTVDLAFKHTVHTNYPGIIVLLGGDMISGGIHDELRETNEGPINVTLLEVFEHMVAMLELLADKFGRVFVPCVVGNHGRQTLKPRAKHRVFENYEYVLYCMLERHFRNDPRIQFQIPAEADAHFAVYGHRYMLTHGDALGVKGGDGIIGALGPIARGTLKTARFQSQVGRDFDTLAIGHWHSYIPRSKAVPVVVNGALKGYDEYAQYMLRAPFSVASQAIWWHHPKYGITVQREIKLQEEPKSAADRGAEWVSWEIRK
jgi:hypothetical protein